MPAEGAARWRRRPGAPVVLVVLVVVGALLAVAGVRVAQWASGGGAQPAQVLPGDAQAYLAVDLDPPAGQKVQALRLLRSLPERGDGGGPTDARSLVLRLVGGRGPLAQLDWERDVAPWAGERVGAVVRPPDPADPLRVRAVVAVAVRDEDAARRALERVADGAPAPAWAVGDGWAVLAADRSELDAAVRDARERPLADDPAFAADVAALGGRGVATAWAVSSTVVAPALGAALEVGPGAGPEAVASALRVTDSALGPRTAAVLRVDGGVPHLVARSRGGWAVPPAQPAAPGLADLPADAALAVAASGLDDALAGAWLRLVEDQPLLAGALGGSTGQRTRVEERIGVELPEGLMPLAGDDLALVVGADGAWGTRGLVLRTRTADPPGAGRALDRLLALLGAEGVLDRRTAGSRVLHAAGSPPALAALAPGAAGAAGAAGALGASPSLARLVPDVDGAVAAAHIDLDALVRVLDLPADSTTARFAGTFAAAGARLAVPEPGVLELDVRLAPR